MVAGLREVPVFVEPCVAARAVPAAGADPVPRRLWAIATEEAARLRAERNAAVLERDFLAGEVDRLLAVLAAAVP